jgi:uncharacterized protein
MTYEFIPQFSKMLTNLSGLLDKAQKFADQRKFDVSNLLVARLAPDQFHFTRQVQVACDTAKAYAARLTGKEAPKHEDKETTIAELQHRIQATIQFLSTIKPEDFKGWETRQVLNPRREGKFLPGNEYAMQQAIPNFYFHVTTAYAILRHNGMEIGKMDFLGELNYRPL